MVTQTQKRTRANESPQRKPLTPAAVAILTEEIIAIAEFDDFVVVSLVCIANELIASCFEPLRIEDLAAALKQRAYSLSAHSNQACDVFSVEGRETVKVAIESVRSRE